MKKPILSVSDVSCGYFGKDVVSNVTFTVQENECISVMGQNGCGKTTLFKAIAGLLPCTGDINVSGLKLTSLSRKEIARNIAVAGQMPDAFFPFTVWDTVMHGRYAHSETSGLFHKLTSDEDRREVSSAISAMELSGLEERLITELSGGQLQRVFLARSFAQSPKLILLDEPTSHLDIGLKTVLAEYLRKWVASPGRAAVSIFHDINIALQSDKVLLLKNGKAIAFAPPVLSSKINGRSNCAKNEGNSESGAS